MSALCVFFMVMIHDFKMIISMAFNNYFLVIRLQLRRIQLKMLGILLIDWNRNVVVDLLMLLQPSFALWPITVVIMRMLRIQIGSARCTCKISVSPDKIFLLKLQVYICFADDGEAP